MFSKLTVYVKDSITKMPVAVAEVSVSVGDQKVSAGHTDREEGSFTKSIDPQYVGQPLTCRVSKDGYEPQEVTRDVHDEGIEIELALVPETVEFILTVMDEKERPLNGVSVTVEAGGKAVGSSYSDGDGLARFRFSPGLESKRIIFKAELDGFERTEGEIELTKEVTKTISLRRKAVLPKGNVKRALVIFILGTIITFVAGWLLGLFIAEGLGIGRQSQREPWAVGIAIIVWLSGGIFTFVLARKVWRGESNKWTAPVDKLIGYVEHKVRKDSKHGTKRVGQ